MHRTYKQLLLNRRKQLHIFYSNSQLAAPSVGLAKGMVFRDPLNRESL